MNAIIFSETLVALGKIKAGGDHCVLSILLKRGRDYNHPRRLLFLFALVYLILYFADCLFNTKYQLFCSQSRHTKVHLLQQLIISRFPRIVGAHYHIKLILELLNRLKMVGIHNYLCTVESSNTVPTRHKKITALSSCFAC